MLWQMTQMTGSISIRTIAWIRFGQSIQCPGDVSPVPLYWLDGWSTALGQGHTHRCRKWNSIREWVDRRNLGLDEKRLWATECRVVHSLVHDSSSRISSLFISIFNCQTVANDEIAQRKSHSSSMQGIFVSGDRNFRQSCWPLTFHTQHMKVKCYCTYKLLTDILMLHSGCRSTVKIAYLCPVTGLVLILRCSTCGLDDNIKTPSERLAWSNCSNVFEYRWMATRGCQMYPLKISLPWGLPDLVQSPLGNPIWRRRRWGPESQA